MAGDTPEEIAVALRCPSCDAGGVAALSDDGGVESAVLAALP